MKYYLFVSLHCNQKQTTNKSKTKWKRKQAKM